MSFLQSRFWRRNLALFVVPVAVPLAIVAAFSIRGGPLEHVLGVPVLQADLTGPPIPYHHLATEATDPHPMSGKPRVSEDWLRAISDVPDVRDCLEPDQQALKRPDLRRFDWLRVRGRERDICLFRVFSSLGTPERATAWIRSQGFEPHEPVPYAWGDKASVVVGGGYSPRDDDVLLPGGPVLGRWITAHIVYAETISASWSADGALLIASFSSNSL